ncbi:hypothetical protein KCV07_g45, partial [Aureobasidium melanogenum]
MPLLPMSESRPIAFLKTDGSQSWRRISSVEEQRGKMGDGGRGKQRALINKHGPNTPQKWLQLLFLRQSVLSPTCFRPSSQF